MGETNRQRIMNAIRRASPAKLTRAQVEAAVPDIPIASTRGVLRTLGERPEEKHVVKEKLGDSVTSPCLWYWRE